LRQRADPQLHRPQQLGRPARPAALLREVTRVRRAAWLPGCVVVWLLARAALPNGLPLGVVLLGVTLGSLTALTAMGLVLVYRASRVVNFAQAELGGLATTCAV